MTRLVRFDGGSVAFFPAEVAESARRGGMVIYPTDTLYGLGVDPRSRAGLSRLLAAKGREGRKPIPLLLDDPARAPDWAAEIPDAAARLMGRFWPGALTIVLPAAAGVLPAVTAGGSTVGLRVPDHPIARALARALGGAVTGTSANRAGNPGIWRTAEEIVREFTGEVEWVLWDGPSPAAGKAEGAAGASPASTVVRAEGGEVSLLREGVIPFRTITDFLSKG
ncbi:MAG: L-threonylcarbamoyladenylate synthase [Deltaproteobacteria bacterium]|nr:L-threonylcarbamoyladenylate synthase [Deltaproteobacteria bacterium]